MRTRKILEFKLKGERNISSRIPVANDDYLFTMFKYDKNYFESKVICLKKNNFEIVWEYKYPFIANNMLIYNDKLFVTTMDGVLIELDAKSGKFLSDYHLKLDRSWSSSAIYNGLIAIGGIQGTEQTTCFNLSDKKIKWIAKNNGHSSIPLIIENKVLQCTEDQINCFELDTGKQLWYSKKVRGFLRNPMYFKSSILVGGRGHISFYNLKNGKIVGDYSEENMGTVRKIIDYEDCLYFGDNLGKFYAVKITLKKEKFCVNKLWEYNSDGAIESLPVLNEHKVFFINDDNKLICLDRSTGELIWKFNTKAEAGVSGLVLDEDNIYATVSKGYAYKIRIN